MESEQQTPPEQEPTSGRSVDVQAMVSQLQQMIEQVATAATPALKEVAAKAAELAASAAVHAGPIAHKVANQTDRVGKVVASKGRGIASDLRQSRAADVARGEAASANGSSADGSSADDTSNPTDASPSEPSSDAG
jgi:hypothetical protein